MGYNARTDGIDPRKGRAARKAKARSRAAHVVLIGFGGLATAAMVCAWVVLATGPRPAEAALVVPKARLAVASLAPVEQDEPVEPAAPAEPVAVGTVTNIMDFRSAGVLAVAEDWVYAPPVVIALAPAPAPAADQADAPAAEAEASVPLPPARPLLAERAQGEEFSLKAPAEPLAIAPLPLKNPLADRGESGKEESGKAEVAALPPPQPGPSPGDEPELNAEVTLPGRSDRYAVYDIRAKTVYLPGGQKLEAHSGLGDLFDDPRHVSVKMRGPTPPNVYDLSVRESLFHGVEALRMTPVDNSKMYGRDGILAHSYMLGPRGDSNGCLSFKEYDKFLAAYKRGEVSRIVVVAQMPKAPARNLFSWLKI